MEAYIAAILNSIKDGQDIKQVPPAAFFNRTEEEVIANMEESRELDEQWAPQKKDLRTFGRGSGFGLEHKNSSQQSCRTWMFHRNDFVKLYISPSLGVSVIIRSLYN